MTAPFAWRWIHAWRARRELGRSRPDREKKATRGQATRGSQKGNAIPDVACSSPQDDVASTLPQPLGSEDQGLQLIANGEFYESDRLREALLTRGHKLRSRSDSEVLLHLYHAEGDAFVQRLNGMFDFALWDARQRRLLI